jgi:hypothetical protein
MIIGDTFMRVTEDTVRKLGLKADRVFLAQVSRNTNTRTHARTHARARAYTHTHTHTCSHSLCLSLPLSLPLSVAHALSFARFFWSLASLLISRTSPLALQSATAREFQ